MSYVMLRDLAVPAEVLKETQLIDDINDITE